MEITELVKKSKAGDSEAFGQIYDLFADRLFRFIRMKVGDQRQAEDILQDVFVKAWQGLGKLELEDLNFNAWIYRIAGNTINDYYRKLYRSPMLVELNEEMSQGAVSAEELSFMDMELVRKALEDLPSHYKQIIELRYIQEFSVAETAKVMGKTGLAVRLIQHRALKKLQEKVSKQFILEEA